ncbi:MAG: SLBB domain-containing protein [Parachlamydiaceae bacterium]
MSLSSSCAQDQVDLAAANPQIPPTYTTHLTMSEWIAVIAILGFLACLTLFNLLERHEAASEIAVGPGVYLKPQYMDVHIEGAVKKPGVYRVKASALMKDVIAIAEPTLEADLKRFRERAKVTQGQNIVVPAREMLTIHVSGAVQKEGDVIVPKGTRLQDLCRYLAFTDEADLNKVRSKRYLKAGETINIPVKHAKKGNLKSTH